eukprot:jgi/Mesvir1/22529/Mv25756-RA.1
MQGLLKLPQHATAFMITQRSRRLQPRTTRRHPWTFRDRLGMDMCYPRRNGLTPGQPPGMSVIWRQMVRNDRWQEVMKETTPKSVGAPRVTKYGTHSDSGRGAHNPVTRS